MSDINEQFSDDPKACLQERNLDLKLKEIEIRKRAVELPVELAQLGLRGTLTGAIAGAILLVILAVIAACSEKIQINGWHLCIIAGIICTTVVLYGAFVFDRSFRLAGQWEKKFLELGVGDNPPPSKRTDDEGRREGTMNEEIDLDHLGFTISSTDRPNPVQRIYLTKDEVRDTINEDFKRGGRKGTFRIDAFHECHWWYSPPAPEAKA